MDKKAVSGIILRLFLILMLSAAFCSVATEAELKTVEYSSDDPEILSASGSGNSWVWIRDTITGAWGEAVVGTGDALYIARKSNLYRYLPADNSWTTLAAPPNPDAGDTFKTGTALAWDFGDYIYALYGAATSDSRRWFYRYSISGNSWQALANTTADQGEGDAMTWVGLDNQIYATIGGEQRATYFLRYDPSTNTWSDAVVADPPAGMGDGASLVWAGGEVLYALRGEFLEESPTYDFWRYSIASDIWTAMADIPAYAHDGGVGGVGDGGSLLYIGLWLSNQTDFIYALSGNQAYPESPSPIPDNRFYRYTVSTDSWESLADLPFGVGYYVGCRIGYADGHIYAWQGTPSTWTEGGDDLARYDFAPLPRTWTVDDDGPADFHTIQEAINAASPEDTIYVYNGTYYENVVVTKNGLALIGENRETTKIDGGGTETVVKVMANNTIITKFTMQNGFYGVYLGSVFSCSVSGNNMKNNDYGTRLVRSSYCSVLGNTATNNGYGINVYESYGCFVSGNNVTNNNRGIVLDNYSSNCSVFGNNANNNNWQGIHLWESSNCSVYENNATNNDAGISLYRSFDCSAYSNNAINNDWSGIWLSLSSGSVLRDNNMTGNGVYDFGVYGESLEDYIHDIDVSNILDGKSIIYWVNQSNKQVPANAGYVAIVNSTNITVENLTLTNKKDGVLFAGATNSTIKNVTVNNNEYGIRLRWSSNCSVYRNTATNNGVTTGVTTAGIHLYECSDCYVYSNNATKNIGHGIWLWYSPNNTVENNTITNNKYHGVSLDHSSGCFVYGNTAINNEWSGIYLHGSSGCSLFGNSVNNSKYAGIHLDYSSWYCYVSNNNANNNDHGIWLRFSSSYCTIYGNTATNNNDAGIYLSESSNCSIYGNNIKYNWYGIRLDEASDNGVFYNNFIENTFQADVSGGLGNIWDNGYPSGGNYWSDYYNGVDEFSGPFQNETGSDGIGDAPYIIDANNRDRYPLLTPTTAPDEIPPITIDNYNDLWHNTDFIITLTAADYQSGVMETYYRINDGPTKTVSIDGQPLITTEGINNKLEYWSVDKAENEETHKILTGIKLDKTAPTGSITIENDAAYTNSTSITLTLTATDAMSDVYQVRYSNDGVWDTEAWELPLPTKAWTLTSGDGTKTVYYQIEDNAGLISEPYSDTIILDTVPPTGFITINDGAAYTITTSVTLTLSATDETSGVAEVRFSNDNITYTEWQTYIPSKSWTLQDGDGVKTVYVQFRDQACLISTYSNAITLDTTPPAGSITIAGGATYTNSSSVTLTLPADDATSAVSQMRFSNDNATWTLWETYSTSKAWTLTTGDGAKTVYVQYLDNAGLVSQSYSDTITLDTVPPAIIIASPSPGYEMKSSTITVTWTGSDDTSGISHYAIKLDDYSWINVGTNTTHTFIGLSDGSHAIEVKAFDNAGLTKQDSVAFIVNTSPLLGPGYTEVAAILATTIIAAIGIVLYFFKIRKR